MTSTTVGASRGASRDHFHLRPCREEAYGERGEARRISDSPSPSNIASPTRTISENIIYHQDSGLQWEEIICERVGGYGSERQRGGTESKIQIAIAALVCLEAITIGADVSVNDGNSSRSILFDVLDHTFLSLWVLDLFRVMRRDRCTFCRDRWNRFEVFLVVTGIIDAWIVRYLPNGDALAWIRSLKTLRIMRLAKLSKLVPKVERILQGFLASFRTTGWVLVSLFLIVYSAAVYITISVGHDCSSTYSFWSECETQFGALPESMLTLFQVMTFDSWIALVARPILERKPWLIVFFCTFLMLTSFGLLNIVVGVIVESTLNASDEVRRAEEEEANRQLSDHLQSLKFVFEQADLNGNGDVDMDEFKNILKDRRVLEILQTMRLPIKHPERLFNVLDVDQQGSISITEFVEGTLKLREMPTPMEMHTLVFQMHQCAESVETLEIMLSALLRHFSVPGAEVLGEANIAARLTSRASRSPCRSTRSQKVTSRSFGEESTFQHMGSVATMESLQRIAESSLENSDRDGMTAAKKATSKKKKGLPTTPPSPLSPTNRARDQTLEWSIPREFTGSPRGEQVLSKQHRSTNNKVASVAATLAESMTPVAVDGLPKLNLEGCQQERQLGLAEMQIRECLNSIKGLRESVKLRLVAEASAYKASYQHTLESNNLDKLGSSKLLRESGKSTSLASKNFVDKDIQDPCPI